MEKRDSLTGEEIFTLQEIANQCPLVGGMSVFHVENLLSMSDHFLIFNKMRSCESISRLSNLKPFLNNPEFNVYPNPSNQIISLNSSQDFGDNSIVEIYNLLGNKLKKVMLERKSSKIDINVSDLSPGMYYITYSENNNLLFNKKIVILH